jgi:general secretion pathway protein E
MNAPTKPVVTGARGVRVVQSSNVPGVRPLRTQIAKRLASLKAATEENVRSGFHPDYAVAALLDATQARASDVHLEPVGDAVRVRFRIDGSLSDVAELSVETGKCLANQIKALAGLDPVVRFTPRDSHYHFSAGGEAVDLRIAVAPGQFGETLSVRLLDPRRLERSIDNLGLIDTNLAQLENWLENTNGMFLAAGPTGSGKTTTLYALLHRLNVADKRIITIEDPVEYAVPGITQIQLDEKHHLSFGEGVKAVLRLDPDLVMLGEIRDGASARAAVDAAISGRVLLSTIHSHDAVGAITALRNWGLPDHEIAESISVILTQRLVRRLCEHCKVSARPTSPEMTWLGALNLEVPREVWTATGCDRCSGTGYFGRTGIFEVWRLSETDYEMILAGAHERALRKHFHQFVGASLLQDAMSKVRAGVTSLSEVKRASAGAFQQGPDYPCLSGTRRPEPQLQITEAI